MFRKHTLKRLPGIAVAATLAVAAAPSALGAHDTWYRNAVSQNANRPYVPFVTDMQGGNGHRVAGEWVRPAGLRLRRASPACPRRFGSGPRPGFVARPDIEHSSNGFN